MVELMDTQLNDWGSVLGKMYELLVLLRKVKRKTSYLIPGIAPLNDDEAPYQ